MAIFSFGIASSSFTNQSPRTDPMTQCVSTVVGDEVGLTMLEQNTKWNLLDRTRQFRIKRSESLFDSQNTLLSAREFERPFSGPPFLLTDSQVTARAEEQMLSEGQAVTPDWCLICVDWLSLLLTDRPTSSRPLPGLILPHSIHCHLTHGLFYFSPLSFSLSTSPHWNQREGTGPFSSLLYVQHLKSYPARGLGLTNIYRVNDWTNAYI